MLTNKGYSVANKEEIENVLCKQTEALATLTVLDPQFKHTTASLLASAILYVARKKLNFSKIWTAHLVKITG